MSGVLLTALFLLQGSTAKSVLDVCAACQSAGSRVVFVRGTAAFSRDGPSLIDYTCPVAATGDFTLPSTVLLAIREFADQATRDRFRNLTQKAIFQVIVRGTLECRHPMTVERSDDGDITSANGYGFNGLHKCRMRDARLLQVHALE